MQALLTDTSFQENVSLKDSFAESACIVKGETLLGLSYGSNFVIVAESYLLCSQNGGIITWCWLL